MDMIWACIGVITILNVLLQLTVYVTSCRVSDLSGRVEKLEMLVTDKEKS